MSRLRFLLAFALPVLVADWATKRLVVAWLQPAHTPHRLIGDAVRLTLTYNRQGVMGLPVGPWGRWLLTAITAVVLVVLFRLLRAGDPAAWLRNAAASVIMGGACGNLLDRLMSGRGVVDFIDVGTTAWRFWTFNVADMSIDIGIVLLAWALWREDVRARR